MRWAYSNAAPAVGKSVPSGSSSSPSEYCENKKIKGYFGTPTTMRRAPGDCGHPRLFRVNDQKVEARRLGGNQT